MEFALRGRHPALEILRNQLAEALVTNREYTGVGFFTRFAIPADARRLSWVARLTIGDVYADVSGLEHGACFLIFVENGALAMLECSIVEDAWPAEACLRRLYYVGRMEPGSASLIEVAERDLNFALQR
jgi:hypothetical protein